MGRFAGDPQVLNFYSYVGNNPIVKVDPTGESYAWTYGSRTAPLIAMDGPFPVGDAIAGIAVIGGGIADSILQLKRKLIAKV